MIYVSTLLAFVLTLVWLPLLLGLLRRSGMLRPNYAGERLPAPAGLAILIGLVSAFALTAVIAPPDRLVLAGMAGLAAMALLGLVDDLMGSRESSGLRGHFRRLLRERELTTGALKALGGGLIALFLSASLAGAALPGAGAVKANLPYLIDLAVNALIIALGTNAVNLLDLRPGRAIKGYLAGAAVVIAASQSPAHLALTLPVMAAAVAYLPADLRGRAMMGDTGSNLLGLSLGLAAASGLPLDRRAGVLALLVLFHLYTEKYSLTDTIARVGFLRYLDQLGRPGTRPPARGARSAGEGESEGSAPADQPNANQPNADQPNADNPNSEM
jgi:UDP-GlcNAc:undecaprenyl-phosphate GlcNAc-1-phosphate transferase